MSRFAASKLKNVLTRKAYIVLYILLFNFVIEWC